MIFGLGEKKEDIVTRSIRVSSTMEPETLDPLCDESAGRTAFSYVVILSFSGN
jgi:hypothetical protein